MFTGIVKGLATVVAVEDRDHFRLLTIDGKWLIVEPEIGKSVAINGVCLTISKFDDDKITFEVIGETLDKTDLGALKVGDQVNIEQPLKMGDEFGGHMVQGHVDGVGTIKAKKVDGENVGLSVQVPIELMPFMVSKGSVAIDGVSLTIAELDFDSITLALIPLTLELTTLGAKKIGDTVNIEADYLLKAVLKKSFPSS